jgi:molybdopterin/thiamine biosynthesis adenylyltransferase
MIIFLIASATAWFVGRRMRTPVAARLYIIGLLYLGFLAIELFLPGGDPEPWLILGGLALVVIAYRAVFLKLRGRAREVQAEREAEGAADASTEGPFSQVELERYARHIVLREVGGPGQRALKDAKVLVVGAGGLGSPALLYLGAAGVGTIGVIDDDVVDLSNLQRQIVHADERIGQPKVFSAQASVLAINPHVTIRPYHRRLTPEIAEDLFAEYDLILDGSDSFATREVVNRAAVACGKPVVAGAITQWEGQVTIYDPAGGAPCLACVFPEAPAPGLAPSCAEAGVIGALPGIVGSVMALEAIKEVTGAGTTLRGALLTWDGLDADARRITVKRRDDCPVCGDI